MTKDDKQKLYQVFRLLAILAIWMFVGFVLGTNYEHSNLKVNQEIAKWKASATRALAAAEHSNDVSDKAIKVIHDWKDIAESREHANVKEREWMAKQLLTFCLFQPCVRIQGNYLTVKTTP